jgi:phosphinothricin acetyltransferase
LRPTSRGSVHPLLTESLYCDEVRRVSLITVRQAVPGDAAQAAAIYAPYVNDAAVSFEETPPTVDELAIRIERCLSRWQWLVAEAGRSVVGYAYGTQHRERAAYRWSVEVSVYVDVTFHRHGVGRSLYARLLADLADKGFCHAYAGITLPNEPSVKLHTAMGFTPIGVFRSVGWKFGRWHDVAWFERTLRDSPPVP